MNILSNNDGNELLYKYISSNKKIGVIRLGITELDCVAWTIMTGTPANHQKYMLSNNAGLYGNNFYIDFYNEYKEAITKCNMHAIWDRLDLIEKHRIILDKLCPNSIKFYNRSIEPFYFQTPWSWGLADKTVLIISPMDGSINHQYRNNREKIWENQLLPKFDLKTYKSVQSIGGRGPDNSWIDSLNRMKEEISNIDFDIALLGCGAYAVPLVSHIYNNLHKSAIHIGGALQLLFGIKGKRWDGSPEIIPMINPYWIRPSADETPLAAHTVEGGCYW
jgi:hypothetical protein